jgi:hypothetical protein|tara:strand:+ start:6039 stop:6518 length:480 start_codon:yes stop_codon:yes gene_type:complete
MRNLKTVTTQDHILVIIATDETEAEVTCVTTEEGKRVFPAPFTSFNLEGSFKTFTTNSTGHWNFHRNGVTPIMMFRIQDMESGTVAETANSLVISVMPKDRDYLEKWKQSLLSEDQRDVALNANRDSVVDVVESKNLRKMSQNTFTELVETVDDEVVFE